MKRFFRSSSFKMLLVIFAVVLSGVFFAAVSRNASSPLTSAVSVVFSPLQRLSAVISDNLEDVSASFRSSTLYRAEIVELEKEIEGYRKQLADYDEMNDLLNGGIYEMLKEVGIKNMLIWDTSDLDNDQTYDLYLDDATEEEKQEA